MRKHTKFMAAGMASALVLAVSLTGCGGPTEEQKQAAEQYKAEAEAYMEGNEYTKAQKAMEQALEQMPEDEGLLAAAEELNRKAEEMEGYNKTMEAARADAIPAAINFVCFLIFFLQLLQCCMAFLFFSLLLSPCLPALAYLSSLLFHAF